MPIENRNLKAGTKLIASYHKQAYSAEVVEGEGGKLRYRLADGRDFKSLSAAGMAITGHACDGWVFWSVAPSETATETLQPETSTEAAAETLESKTSEAQPTAETIPATEEPGPVKKRFFRLPNQKGAPEGQTRWYCHDCGKSFLTQGIDIPETCPAGHQAG